MVPGPQAPAAAKKNDPMHGVKLADMLAYLESKHGWEAMGKRIDIRCFKYEPSIGSSLYFLRRSPWARAKVEEWYRKEVFE